MAAFCLNVPASSAIVQFSLESLELGTHLANLGLECGLCFTPKRQIVAIGPNRPGTIASHGGEPPFVSEVSGVVGVCSHASVPPPERSQGGRDFPTFLMEPSGDQVSI
jgi:hypothetical protein